MPCEFLKGNYMLSCSAVRDVYVPSRYELEEYCQSSRYPICPCYAKAERDGRAMKQAGQPFAGSPSAARTGPWARGGRLSS